MKERTETSPSPEPRDDLPIEATRRAAGARCPFCHQGIRAGQQVSRCAGCKARFHLGCLGESTRRGCSTCGGTVLAEDVAGRHARRLRVDDREQRLGALGRSVGVVAFMLTVPLSCVTLRFVSQSLGGLRGLTALVFLIAAVAVPTGVAMLAVRLMRRVTAKRSAKDAESGQ